MASSSIMSMDQIFSCIAKQKLAWIHLDDSTYQRTAFWLPEYYRKEAIWEAHDKIFAGHNAAQKSYIKLTLSYFWPNDYSQVLKHTQTCLRCHQSKSSKLKPLPLAPLPIPNQPNVRIHPTFLVPWWVLNACKPTSCALQMLSPNMQRSLQFPIKKLKQLLEQFSKTVSVNLASQHQFTQMEVKIH